MAFFVLLLEMGLRLLPQAIPLALLKEFNPHVRASVARRRKLPARQDTIVVPRDDGGPPRMMWMFRGGVEVTLPFDEPGIVATVRTDDRGFCNPDAHAYEVARIDVAAVGDSFTWCTNVAPRDAWPSVLARRTGLRTYNFGLPGRGLYEYLQVLKRFALAKRPRVVVLDVYEGNDLRDAVRFYAARAAGARASDATECPFPSSRLCAVYTALIDGPVGRYSYAANLAATGLWRLAYLARRENVDFTYYVTGPDGKRVEFNSRDGDQDEVVFARKLQAGEVHLDVFDEALRSFVSLAREQRFLPLVVYTPSAYTAYGEHAAFADPTIAATLRGASDRLRHYFAQQSGTLGYHFRDLTPALRAAAERLPSGGPLYFRTNVHLTQMGHAVVADEVAEALTELGVRGPDREASGEPR